MFSLQRRHLSLLANQTKAFADCRTNHPLAIPNRRSTNQFKESTAAAFVVYG